MTSRRLANALDIHENKKSIHELDADLMRALVSDAGKKHWVMNYKSEYFGDSFKLCDDIGIMLAIEEAEQSWSTGAIEGYTISYVPPREAWQMDLNSSKVYSLLQELNCDPTELLHQAMERK